MIAVAPVTLAFNGLRLEPLAPRHADGLRAAASDGELWNLVVTSVPAPHDAPCCIDTALSMPYRQGFAVVGAATDAENVASQAAIERLGARLAHHATR